MVDIRHDLSDMFLRPAADADANELGEAFERLETEGRELLKSEGVSDDDVSLDRSIAMRYLGQWRSLEVATTATSTRRWSASTPSTSASSPTAATTRRSSSTGSRSWPRARPRTSSSRSTSRAATCPSRSRRRDVYFDGEAVDTPVYERNELPAGASFEGPAVIDQLDTTTLVPPGVKAEVDEYLNIVMEVN